MFAKISLGVCGSIAVKAAIILNNFGLCCAYFKIFGDVCSSLVSLFINDQDSFFINNWHNFFYVLVVFALMFPLIFKDSIEALKVMVD